MLGNPNHESDLLYGRHAPARPARSLGTALSNPAVRLMDEGTLAAMNTRRSEAESLTWPCTPLVEATPDGAQLSARPYAGLTFTAEERRRHAAIVGATGSGKTYRVALPVLAATLRDTTDSAVFFNLKGPAGTDEIREIAARLAPDTEVVVFAPTDASRSVGCNLFALAHLEGLVEHLVRFICSMVPRGSGDSSFWEQVAERMLKAALRHHEVGSLAALHELFSDPAVLHAFAKHTRDRELLQFDLFRESGSNGSTSWADIAARIAPLVSSPDVRATTSGKHEFNPATRLTSGSRFLVIVECNESDFESHARHLVGLWFSLFMACAVKAAEASGGRLKRPVSFFLDEFGVMPPIPGFHRTANLGRSRGMSFFVFLQSIEQLQVNYGTTAGAVLASLCTKVFLCSGLSVMDREFASRLAGSVHVTDWRAHQTLDPHTGEWLPSTRHEHVMTRPLVSPEDLILSPHPVFGPFAYVFPVDRPPLLAHFTAAFDVPVLADAMEKGREQKKGQRAAPLPAVLHSGHFTRITRPPLTNETRSVKASSLTGNEAYKLAWELLDQMTIAEKSHEARSWAVSLLVRHHQEPHQFLRFLQLLVQRKASLIQAHQAMIQAKTQSLAALLHYLDYMRVRDAEDAAAKSTSDSGVVFKGRTTVVRRVQRPKSSEPPPRPGCSSDRSSESDPRRLCGQGASDMLLWE